MEVPPPGLASDSAEERSAAYGAIETAVVDDAEGTSPTLGAACVPELVNVLGRPASDVAAAEFMRVALLLADLALLDPTAVSGEWMKVKGPLKLNMDGNALKGVISKPIADLQRADAMLLCASQSSTMAMQVRGYDPGLALAGISSFHEWHGCIDPHAWYFAASDELNIKVSLLVLAALKDPAERMSETLRAGAWSLLDRLASPPPNGSRLPVAVIQVQSGGLQTALAELMGAESPLHWVSISRTPSSKYAAVIEALCAMAAIMFQHKDLLLPDEAKDAAAGLLVQCLKAVRAPARKPARPPALPACISICPPVCSPARLSAYVTWCAALGVVRGSGQPR